MTQGQGSKGYAERYTENLDRRKRACAVAQRCAGKDHLGIYKSSHKAFVSISNKIPGI